MALIVLIGAQAVGKMTVGRELEKRIDGKLLYNHQTIDLYANFLGYGDQTFRLSDETHFSLFNAFIKNREHNVTNSIIFTVLVDFGNESDKQFLTDISQIFLQAEEEVYFIELVADVETRLERNTHPERLAAKPSKRDLDFSRQELLSSVTNSRLESLPGELEKCYPEVRSITIENTKLTPDEVISQIMTQLNLR